MLDVKSFFVGVVVLGLAVIGAGAALNCCCGGGCGPAVCAPGCVPPGCCTEECHKELEARVAALEKEKAGQDK